MGTVYPTRVGHIVDDDNSYFIALYTTEYFDRLMKITRDSSIAGVAPVLNFLLLNLCQPRINSSPEYAEEVSR